MDGQPVRESATHRVRTELPTERPIQRHRKPFNGKPEGDSAAYCVRAVRPTDYSIQLHPQLINGIHGTKRAARWKKTQHEKSHTMDDIDEILDWPNVCIDRQSALSRFQMPGSLWTIEAIASGLLEPLTLPHSPRMIQFYLTFHFLG